ncbi:MAG: hypothetical protein N2316_09090, partial [Spirochaetes bacterium]|nr:hypothetical protein [Spirochaetota bacterium]
MNKKLSVTFFAILFSCVVVVPAISQELTNDVAILRGGWIPSYSVDFKEDTDWEFSGFAVMGEYNLNISPILLAFGIEYQRVVHEKDNNDDIDVTAGFLVPQIAAKFFVPGGFYIGAGLAGKYLISYDMEDLKTDKTIDLWLNGIVGF